MRKNKDNTHPWILCVGSPTKISSAVLVCDHKVVTTDIGKLVFSALLILLAFHYTYIFSYNPLSQQILEFLQEKLLGDRLPSSRKTSTAYSNMFRAVECIEQKLSEKVGDDNEREAGEDSTQAVCEFN